MNLQIAEFEFYPCKIQTLAQAISKNKIKIFIEDNEIALILCEGECIEKQILQKNLIYIII